MIKYIVQDLKTTLRFLPLGMLFGMVSASALSFWNKSRVQKGKKSFDIVPKACFLAYVGIVMVITFFSREPGSRIGFDLELFSTWGINTRNNAYVIENILLFIPFGFLTAWAIRSARSIQVCLMLGLAFSLGIECMQLFTGRGYFQIDDILTNAAGTVLGWLLFWGADFRW